VNTGYVADFTSSDSYTGLFCFRFNTMKTRKVRTNYYNLIYVKDIELRS